MPGEQLTFDRFVAPSEVARYARAVQAPDGLLEISMSLSPERIVGGSVLPGDTVALVASFELEPDDVELPDGLTVNLTTDQAEALLDDLITQAAAGSEVDAITHILTHKVLVTNVQEEELPQDTLDANGDVVGSTSPAPTGNLIVTVAVDAPTVERIVFTAEFGRVWIAAEPLGASEEGTEEITILNIFDDE